VVDGRFTLHILIQLGGRNARNPKLSLLTNNFAVAEEPYIYTLGASPTIH